MKRGRFHLIALVLAALASAAPSWGAPPPPRVLGECASLGQRCGVEGRCWNGVTSRGGGDLRIAPLCVAETDLGLSSPFAEPNPRFWMFELRGPLLLRDEDTPARRVRGSGLFLGFVAASFALGAASLLRRARGPASFLPAFLPAALGLAGAFRGHALTKAAIDAPTWLLPRAEMLAWGASESRWVLCWGVLGSALLILATALLALRRAPSKPPRRVAIGWYLVGAAPLLLAGLGVALASQIRAETAAIEAPFDRSLTALNLELPRVAPAESKLADVPLALVRRRADGGAELLYDDSRGATAPVPPTDLLPTSYDSLGPDDLGRPPFLLLAADRRVGVGALRQALTPLTERGHSALRLLLRGDSDRGQWATFDVAFATSPDEPTGPILSHWSRRRIDFNLRLTEAGMHVELDGRNVAPGCRDYGPGVTVPQDDWSGLHACAARIQASARWAVDAGTACLRADDGVPFERLVRAIAAIRRDDEGQAMFFRVHVAPPRAAKNERHGDPWMPDRLIEVFAPRPALPALPSSPPRSANVVVTLGAPSVQGTTETTSASAIAAGMTAGFRRCYRRGLETERAMRGSLEITAKIGPDGEVLSAVPSKVKGLSNEVVTCVVTRVMAAMFAPPTSGGATISFPASFNVD